MLFVGMISKSIPRVYCFVHGNHYKSSTTGNLRAPMKGEHFGSFEKANRYALNNQNMQNNQCKKRRGC